MERVLRFDNEVGFLEARPLPCVRTAFSINLRVKKKGPVKAESPLLKLTCGHLISHYIL